MRLNPYHIWWIEFVPEKGCVTKHDRKVFGDILLLGNRARKHRKHFPSKEDAIDYLTNFNKKLDKHYTCYLFTDKQFGMAVAENDYAIPFTKKQLENPYYL